MADQVFQIVIPEDLKELAKEAGYNESYIWRGGGSEAAVVSLELIGTWISLGANGITILVGFSQFRGLVDLARGWASRRSKEQPDEQIDTLQFAFKKRAGTRSETLTLAISDESLSGADVRKVASFLEAVAEVIDDDAVSG